jgi:hypothetical protein
MKNIFTGTPQGKGGVPVFMEKENVFCSALHLLVAVLAGCRRPFHRGRRQAETEEKQGEKLFLEKCLPVT